MFRGINTPFFLQKWEMTLVQKMFTA